MAPVPLRVAGLSTIHSAEDLVASETDSEVEKLQPCVLSEMVTVNSQLGLVNALLGLVNMLLGLVNELHGLMNALVGLTTALIGLPNVLLGSPNVLAPTGPYVTDAIIVSPGFTGAGMPVLVTSSNAGSG
jgi:uncharacterized membrane protein YkgB